MKNFFITDLPLFQAYIEIQTFLFIQGTSDTPVLLLDEWSVLSLGNLHETEN